MKSSKVFRLPAKRKIKAVDLLPVYRKLRKHFGHQHWWPGDSAFEVIVGAILTQNTAWSNVEKAIRNLKKHRLLTPERMKRVSRRRLAGLIRPAGYFNIKADRLKHFVRFLHEHYGGSLQKLFSEDSQVLRDRLLAVNGIGPETADSILLYAGNKPFFVIDAYTKRIFGRHRFLSPDQDYTKWQDVFRQALPESVALFNDYHAQIVMLGKHFCRTTPACSLCPLREYL